MQGRRRRREGEGAAAQCPSYEYCGGTIHSIFLNSIMWGDKLNCDWCNFDIIFADCSLLYIPCVFTDRLLPSVNKNYSFQVPAFLPGSLKLVAVLGTLSDMTDSSLGAPIDMNTREEIVAHVCLYVIVCNFCPVTNVELHQPKYMDFFIFFFSSSEIRAVNNACFLVNLAVEFDYMSIGSCKTILSWIYCRSGQGQDEKVKFPTKWQQKCICQKHCSWGIWRCQLLLD